MIFNEYGVVPIDSPSDKILMKLHEEWRGHCQRLLLEGASPVELRALTQEAEAYISCAMSEVILVHAINLRQRDRNAKLTERTGDFDPEVSPAPSSSGSD